MEIEIHDLSEENVDDALLACTPDRIKDNFLYKRGMEIRKKWLLHIYRTIGPCVKIAYVNKVPVGMIQYTPLHHVPYFTTKRRDALYIHCIYTKRDFRLMGVAGKLLENLTKEMKHPNPIFGNEPCRLLATSARERYGSNQPSYFRKKGFRSTTGNIDAGLILWLYKPSPNERLDIPMASMAEVNEKGVRIFFNPTCQWCIYLNEGVKRIIRELNPDVQIEEISLYDDPEEALNRGITCRVTYVNGKPAFIGAAFPLH